MIRELESLSDLGTRLCDRARASGVLLIWRAQARLVARTVVREGKPEDSVRYRSSGHGIHVFTPEGRTALASRDDFRPEPALALLSRAVESAARGGALGLVRSRMDELAPASGREVPEGIGRFEDIDIGRVARRLAELEAEIAATAPGVSLRLAYQAELEGWRILRSDGTDVLFAVPRCTMRVSASSGGADARHSVSTTVASPDPGLAWEPATVRRLVRRAKRAAALARDLVSAPTHPAGSFPLVIDYALAKGLAHEAFGHAAEADSFRSSVLAEGGRFRVGEKVGDPSVSVVDEPIAGDHAWQPFSANGEPRRRAVIVDHGRLRDGLSDPWSAGPGGVPLSGAARTESFRHAPLPRMSNIRIEVDGALPAPGDFEEYEPEQVRDLLDGAGVFRRHPCVVFLSGYSGGQANPASGDFVFNCKSIYRLDRDGVSFHKPAIFSGSMFGALDSVREAFGPLRLDAIGTCGKWGQSVPSSGGSHYFLVLDPDPRIRLGGT